MSYDNEDTQYMRSRGLDICIYCAVRKGIGLYHAIGCPIRIQQEAALLISIKPSKQEPEVRPWHGYLNQYSRLEEEKCQISRENTFKKDGVDEAIERVQQYNKEKQTKDAPRVGLKDKTAVELVADMEQCLQELKRRGIF